MKTFDIDMASSVALDKFLNEGWNCAESTLYSILAQTELSSEEIERYISTVSGFNGGIGGSKDLCGAISGAVAAVGATVGRFGVYKHNNNPECSAIAKRIFTEFVENYETADCGALTCEFDTTQAKERRIHCSSIVQFASETAVKALNDIK